MTSWLLDEGAPIPIWGALQCPHDLIFRLGESTHMNSQHLQAPRLQQAWLLCTTALTLNISIQTTADEEVGMVSPSLQATVTTLIVPNLHKCEAKLRDRGGKNIVCCRWPKQCYLWSTFDGKQPPKIMT